MIATFIMEMIFNALMVFGDDAIDAMSGR